MRIALTGASGIGKTTIARRLAAHFDIPVLPEDFKEVVLAFTATTTDMKKSAMCRKACLRWLQRRELLINKQKEFIEDRCAIDILSRWLMANLSRGDNDETQKLIDVTRAFLDHTDYIVILPSTQVGEDKVNESGLIRGGDLNHLIRTHVISTGIAYQFADHSRIINVPDTHHSIEARMQYILGRINEAS